MSDRVHNQCYTWPKPNETAWTVHVFFDSPRYRVLVVPSHHMGRVITAVDELQCDSRFHLVKLVFLQQQEMPAILSEMTPEEFMLFRLSELGNLLGTNLRVPLYHHELDRQYGR